MTAEKRKVFFLFLIGGLVGILGMYIYQNIFSTNATRNKTTQNTTTLSIDQLTKEKLVIDYVKESKKLPDYYITKKEARNLGWIPDQGNLCELLPGKAIGGDYFQNREKKLPPGTYYEADVNYHCGNRNAERIIYNDKSEVWLTKNHYKSFEKQ